MYFIISGVLTTLYIWYRISRSPSPEGDGIAGVMFGALAFIIGFAIIPLAIVYLLASGIIKLFRKLP